MLTTRPPLLILLSLTLLSACEDRPLSVSAPPPIAVEAPPAAPLPLTSESLRRPFDSPALNDALTALRRDDTARHLELERPRGALLEAREALAAALQQPLASPAAAQRASLLALRLFPHTHYTTAAALTPALARLAIPALYDDLTLDLSRHLQRAAGVDLARSRALLDPLRDHAELDEAQRLLAESYARGVEVDDAARLLIEMVGSGQAREQDALCENIAAILPRAKRLSPAYLELLAVAQHACVGTPSGDAAALIDHALAWVPKASAPAAISSALRMIAVRRLYAQVKHDEVLAMIAPLLADEATPVELRCEALWRQAKTYRFSRRASLADVPYALMEARCKGIEDWHLRALYGQGWIAFLKGAKDPEMYGVADPFFVKLFEQYPQDRHADDALKLRVQIAIQRQDLDLALTIVAPILDGHTRGDNAGEALWRLYEALRDAQHPQAPSLLERGIDALAQDDTYYSIGRLRFAHAEQLERDKKPADAARRYEEILRLFPLSYYAYLSLEALRRLSGEVPEAAHALGVRVAAHALARESALPLPLDLPRRADGVERALAFARGGWSSRAATLLQRLHDDLDNDLGWFVAIGPHYDGRQCLAHDLARRTLTGWHQALPTPQTRLRWEVAYPRPFLSIIEETSRASGVPIHLIYGIIREESGFRVHLESYAHAFGLMQLLFKTARWMAEEHFQHALEPDELTDPPMNIKLGAAYLAHLSRSVQTHLTLQASGYNAGGGKVRKWRRHPTRASLNLPAFVEAIPSRQTRDYSKRVTSSTLVYQVLYGDGEPQSLSFDVFSASK